MPPKVLRRCTICKKFNASYLVEDAEFGKYHLCFSCWKVRQAKVKIVEIKQVTSKT